MTYQIYLRDGYTLPGIELNEEQFQNVAQCIKNGVPLIINVQGEKCIVNVQHVQFISKMEDVAENEEIPQI